jgi:probable rRNA maturation factor
MSPDGSTALYIKRGQRTARRPGCSHKGAERRLAAPLYGAHPAKYKLDAAAKRELTRFAKTLAARVAGGKGFEFLIADDTELRRLNATFLNHDYPTDVLSFPSTADKRTLGEIAISIERAGEQAEQFGHTLLDELQVLMLHGVLHLAGYDHETDNGDMAAAEQRWRSEFNLPQTLIERAEMAEAAL